MMVIVVNKNKKDRIARGILARFGIEIETDIYAVEHEGIIGDVKRSLKINSPKKGDGIRHILFLSKKNGRLFVDAYGVKEERGELSQKVRLVKVGQSRVQRSIQGV
jgi:hypothetical protein